MLGYEILKKKKKEKKQILTQQRDEDWSDWINDLTNWLIQQTIWYRRC